MVHIMTNAAAAPPQAAPASTRRPRPQAVLEVLGKTRITPNLLRVRLGGQGLADLNPNEHTDKYVKLLLPDPASGLVPPYDMDALRQERPEDLPSMRTYTISRWDQDAGDISLDVVLHNDETGTLGGRASVWADAAQPGDLVAMRGAGGGYTPDTAVAHHLLIGDHSALPAIAAALEYLAREAPSASGLALIHLDHAEDVQEMDHPAGIDVQWVIEPREAVLDRVRALDIPEDAQIFAHAERGLIKEIRRHLVRERGIDKARISISAYWALGRIEDQFQAEKREPIGTIDDDE
jgi:NADPH-dependent ferric siderophore reductase